ncbi:MAG: hypothetical protein KDA25_05270 [Phycisphaerales bacterium]|nr:hypothetical protein [Phycisphaerales bacterium]
MTDRRGVTVVNVTSPSYTGTTWLCLLLGSHARAFTLGPPDRVWSMRADPERAGREACRVHGEACGFWPSFFAQYDASRNFYVQLGAFSGRDVIVINNPTPAHVAAELQDPALTVRPLEMIRDARALATSYARHHRVDVYDAIVDFAQHLPRSFAWSPDREDVLGLRYEDLMSDPRGHVARFASFVGLDYDERALAFWEFDHHITSGNQGTIALLKFFQGLPVPNFRNRAFYEAQFDRMRKGEAAFDDQRWQDELGARERFVFDHFCGAANAAWGYEPDRFTTAEREQFLAELREAGRSMRPASTRGWRVAARHVKARASAATAALGRSQRRRLAAVGIVWFVSLVLVWIIAAVVYG